MVVYEGLISLLDTLGTQVVGYTVDLVVASFDDTDPDLVLADLTLAAYSGYISGSIPGLDAAIIVSARAQAGAGNFLFTNSSGSNQTIYGWCVHDSGVLIAAKEYASPVLHYDGGIFLLSQTWYLANLVIV